VRTDAFGGLRDGQLLVAGMFSDTSPRRRPAEDMVRGLNEAGLRPQLFDLAANRGLPSTIAVPNACLEQELTDLDIADVIIVAPPAVTAAAAGLMSTQLPGTQRLIAFWNGPLDEPPGLLQQAASGLDAIWTPTGCLFEIVLAALPEFAGSIDIVAPRQPAPPGPGEDRAACRARLDLPDSAWVVGAELALNETLEGQNPTGILATFMAAFGDDPNAFLVLRCENSDAAPDEFAALSRAAAHPRIQVIDTSLHYLPSASLLRASDAWVALPRDTADRAGVDDALGADLPVITCARGLPSERWGHPALHLVGYSRATNGDKTEWVTPDIAHAAALLRDLRRQRRRPMGDRA
jgi:hypothetical protein